MRKRIRRLGAVTIVWVLASGLSRGAPLYESLQFRAQVELVQLQVGVTGPGGEFVHGLMAQDFLMSVNGRERPVQIAYEIDLREGAADRRAAVVGGLAQTPQTSPLPSAARRRFLLLFDLAFTPRFGMLRARRAALEFLHENVHPGDLVGVATAHAYKSFQLLVPFTGEREAIVAALEGLRYSDELDILDLDLNDDDLDAFVSASELDHLESRVIDYLDQMGELARTMRVLEGRKHVVLLSPGFADVLVTDRALVRSSMLDMIKTFRSADAVVHAVDPRGLRGFDNGPELDSSPRDGAESPFSRLGNPRDGHQALLAIASGTGGTVKWQTNNLTAALASIERETAAYYMIGYGRELSDPPTVELGVHVRRDGVRVTWAPELLTPPPAYGDMTPAQRQLQFADVLADDADRPGLEFEAQASWFPAAEDHGSLVLALRIPRPVIEALADARGDAKVQLEFAAFVRNASGRTAAALRRGVAIDVGGLAVAGDYRQEFYFVYYVDVPPGTCRLRVLMREREAGHLSSRSIPCPVEGVRAGPSLLPPLLLADTTVPQPLQEGAHAGPLDFNGRRLVPLTAPSVNPGDSVRLLLSAYNLPADDVVRQVLAGTVLELESANGRVHTLRRVKVLAVLHDDGALSATRLLLEARVPEEVAAGAARLRARLADPVSGARVVGQSPTTVMGRDVKSWSRGS